MNNSQEHTALCRAILDAIGARPGVIAGLNSIGVAVQVSETGQRYSVTYGWPCPGGPDILAVVAPHGRLLGLEVKTGAAQSSAVQRKVHKALAAVGVEVAVCRSVEDAEDALAAMLTGSALMA
jgi:hypothetical protein